MGKIICDICGSTYQDTAECCPICGCSRDAAVELLGGEIAMEETVDAAKTKGGRFSSKKKKDIFDYDEVNGEVEAPEVGEEENPYEDEEEEYEEEPQHSTFLVILLTVIIFVLLLGAGFLFIRYFLPNMIGDETVPPTQTQQIVETAPATTELTIPCQGMALASGGEAVLNPGGYFLLNVSVNPVDTTDALIFTSADESVATVTEDGRITAVAEGETVIYVTCGDQQLSCKVICKFEEETVPPTEETVPATAEETTAATSDPNVVLKIKKSDLDFRLMAPYSHQIELDCDLKLEDVEWSVEHSHIATVENGYVTALQAGTTVVIAKYGDQEVTCYVRCY